MSTNDSNNTTQAPNGDNGAEIGWRQRLVPVLQATFQSVQQRFSAATKNIEPPSILVPSYADPFVKIGERATVDDRKYDIGKILETYAQQPVKSSKDKDKMNKTMIKLFHKSAVDQGSGTGDDAYFKCVTSSSTGNIDIDIESIYDRLLYCAESKDHPHGVSSFAFAFAAILALSLHREIPNEPPLERNGTSPYFDLSPLYGTNAGETNSIRSKDGRGMLWPDCFCEDRLDMVPDAVPALLVLWNRYHNYAAKQLLWHNENDRWEDPKGLQQDKDKLLAQDEQIFNLARSITSINFMNVIREDFLKGLLGLPLVGPSTEVDILHDARALRGGTVNGYRSTVESYFLYDFSSFVPPLLASNPRDAVTRGKAFFLDDQDIRRRNYTGLKRKRNGYFEDVDLTAILLDATAAAAGAPGANSIADWARAHLVQKIQQGREQNVCSLNEFRVLLGLKPLKSFSEWNSDSTVANAAKELYENNIDKLELLPGLLAEESNGSSGFGFGRTMAWGLAADVITRIRNDPLFTNGLNVDKLTKWGHEDSLLNSRRENGSFNAIMPKLLERTLPHYYPCDSVYTNFPFTVPKESEARIRKLFPEGRLRKKYDFTRPKKGKVKVLRTIEAISKVFNDTDNFRSPYGRNFIELSGGYGHMLGFDDLTLHDRDLMLTLFSLLPDQGAAKRIGTTFAHKAMENLQKRSIRINDKRETIDVVRDLIDATCIRWVCETIYNLPFPDQDMRKMTDKQKQEAIGKAREKELEAHEDFAAFYAYVFRNAEPEIGWSARERALRASKELSDHLEKEMDAITGYSSNANFLMFLRNSFASCAPVLKRILEEYSLHGKRLPHTSAQTFFDRMLKAAEIRPLKHLVDRSDHLTELRKEYQNGSTNDQKARQKVEKQRVIANVVSLAVVISVHFSNVCSQAIDFYMSDKYRTERNALIELCKSADSTNEQIMGYIREAQRIGQRFGLWREAALHSGQMLTIEQGHGYPEVIIEEGDRVYADFTYAHNDPNQFDEPDKVVPGRKVISLLGLGIHKCPAGSFIDQTMSEIFRVIFSQNSLQRAGKNGRLKVTTLHPDAASWDPEVFSEEGSSGYSFYPKKLMLEFDTVEKPEKWEFTENELVEKWMGRMNQALSLFFLTLALFVVSRFFMSLSGRHPSASPASGQVNSECGTPLTDVEPWHIKSFHPKWFGMFGEPAPIIYKTSRWDDKAHIVSVVAIDRRDIDIRIMVDDMDYGARHVDLDPTVECGEDLGKCIGLGFAAALIHVQPGRHTVKAEIVKQNETFVWGKERRRRVMWSVQRCP